MFGAQNFTALVEELDAELEQQRADGPDRSSAQAQRDGWRARVLEIARRRIKSPHEFLDWAKRDRHWSFTLAEVMREATRNPAELAARLLLAIVEELAEERESRAPAVDAGVTGEGAAVPLYAE